MKKRILLFTALFSFILNISAQQSIIKDIFEKFVEEKISYMQEVIDITDDQADQLKVLELKFLMDINSVDNCWFSNSKKKAAKLNSKKQKQLKEILSLDQYIKYDAIENNKIKKHPIWAK